MSEIIKKAMKSIDKNRSSTIDGLLGIIEELAKENEQLKKYTAYLFKISLYYGDPPEYVMSHAKNEEEARIKASLKLRYNCGDPVEPKSLKLVTYF